MAWLGVRLSNCTFAVPIPHLIALPICAAASIHLTIVARRARSQCIALLASFSVDLRLEKDDRRETNVPIRRDGKIKACGTTARDQSRFQCLHIGLSIATTVPRLCNEAQQQHVESASAFAFPQCRHGSFASGSFAVSLGAWLAPTMTRAFVHASAVRAAGITGVCWRQRRSSARSRGRVRWPGRPAGHRRPAHGILSICQPSAAGVQRSRAGGQPHHGAGLRRSPAHAESWSKHAT